MAAFDPIKSGIPEMDKALDNIRLGDNVVWRVSDLSQFRLFMEPYLKQAIEDKDLVAKLIGKINWQFRGTMRPTSIC
ncbi:MAG: hypothetical protein J6W48_01340 [Lachnospiraceae bacterium]|nr:hypothetical protein [Lachnospiraceae bacterium]